MHFSVRGMGTLYESDNLKFIKLDRIVKYLLISQNKLGSRTETSINYKVGR